MEKMAISLGMVICLGFVIAGWRSGVNPSLNLQESLQVTAQAVNGAFGNSFIHHQQSPSQVILELKYVREQESFADRVISFFPYRVTRSSKYVQGIERVYF